MGIGCFAVVCPAGARLPRLGERRPCDQSGCWAGIPGVAESRQQASPHSRSSGPCLAQDLQHLCRPVL
ncbi:hypothetical protein CYB_0616 [Synechococcus sp. JA-2-3B'a(2-13)]|nr:hypothetical protein CYB_0616 [Synechococcus sp. JA-2-3B'a(2-13)]